MAAPSDATRCPRRHRVVHPTTSIPSIRNPQTAIRPLVTITEDAQQPSITKPAQQPSRPTSNCVRRLITSRPSDHVSGTAAIFQSGPSAPWPPPQPPPVIVQASTHRVRCLPPTPSPQPKPLQRLNSSVMPLDPSLRRSRPRAAHDPMASS